MLATVLLAVGVWLMRPEGLSMTAHFEVGEGEVSLDEVLGWGSEVVWVDARAEEYFRKGSVAGAVSMPPERFEETLPLLLEGWMPGSPIVVFCDGVRCDVSHEVAEQLKAAGMSEVFVLAGGWDAWTAHKN